MLNYFIIGMLQGLLEWLPVSSEGFVVFFSSLKGLENVLDLALYLHLGTMLSVLVYFRKDIVELRAEPKFLRFLGIATLVSLIVSFPLYILLKSMEVNGSILIGIFGIGLILTGILLRKGKEGARKELNDFDALYAGFLQGLAVIPGVSRSGSTMFALLSRKIESGKALKASFLMSIPVVLAANVFILLQGFTITFEKILALIVAFAFGILMIDVLLRVAKKVNFSWFCVLFGLVSLLAFVIKA